MAGAGQPVTGRLLDTDAVIHLRDGSVGAIERYRALGKQPHISIMSRVELEAGLIVSPELAAPRRAAMHALLARFRIEIVDEPVVDAYARIVAKAGFSRRKVIDRLIAATALVHDLTLITMNGNDFTDIPGLRLEHWPAQ